MCERVKFTFGELLGDMIWKELHASEYKQRRKWQTAQAFATVAQKSCHDSVDLRGSKADPKGNLH